MLLPSVLASPLSAWLSGRLYCGKQIVCLISLVNRTPILSCMLLRCQIRRIFQVFYHLIQQTITTNGLAALGSQQCELVLHPDGSFIVTNYPRWSSISTPRSRVTNFVSTTGHQNVTTPAFRDGILCAGEASVISDTNGEIDDLALRKKGSPYDLMAIYGDGDEGIVMTFGKKK